MNSVLKFLLPRGFDKEQLIDDLANIYKFRTERPTLRKMALYDTFDWRLFRKSLVLHTSENKLILRKLYQNDAIHRSDIASPPVFGKDLPEGVIKELLEPIIKMRALSKLVERHSRSTSYRVLNPDQKTVVQLVYDEIRKTHEKDSPLIAVYLWLKPVKGYPKYSRNLAHRIKATGLTPRETEDIYFKSLSEVNTVPGSYSSKLRIKLEPDMRSDEASRIILRYLLHVIKTNESFIEKDLDTEFLHDYRVAIRRTRSALVQIKKVFPKKTTIRFKEDFSAVGKISNTLRDLDVYLLKEDSYRTLLPPVLRGGITPLFDYLRRKRAKALKHVTRILGSDEYLNIFDDWEKFLNEPQSDFPAPSNADLKILTLAQERIYRQYGSIVEAGNRILERTDEKKLHALRIECKKLRYLMEFFSSLFSPKKIKILIDQLKALQDNLGAFNDLCVQRDYLLNVADVIPADEQNNKMILMAIGSLIGMLDREKQTTKAAFAKIFLDFKSSPNMQIFRELFKHK